MNERKPFAAVGKLISAALREVSWFYSGSSLVRTGTKSCTTAWYCHHSVPQGPITGKLIVEVSLQPWFSLVLSTLSSRTSFWIFSSVWLISSMLPWRKSFPLFSHQFKCSLNVNIFGLFVEIFQGNVWTQFSDPILLVFSDKFSSCFYLDSLKL